MERSETTASKKTKLREKAELLYGKDFWYIGRDASERIMLADGPHGLRVQKGKTDMAGLNDSLAATVYPAACLSACSWDKELLFRLGEMIGFECIEQGVSLLLGPAVNHKRDPRCGRNFEYFSEDPFLTGELASAYVAGVQSTGTGAVLKHFAGNSQELRRMYSDSLIDERALREIYLRQFEIVVKKADPAAIMTAYNKLNGIYCSQNKKLMTEIARSEWGFKGIFLTDWGAMHDQAASYKAGLDIEMPGIVSGASDLQAAAERGEIDEEEIQLHAERIDAFLLRAKKRIKKDNCFERTKSFDLAEEIAEKSSVLLKNDGILPMPEDKNERIAVIGAFAKEPRIQGGGSSKVNSAGTDDFCTVLEENGIAFDYAPGYVLNKEEPEDALIAEAVAIAAVRKKTIVFVGLNEIDESEGYDRKTLFMPAAHNKLIEKVSEVNANIVVVLSAGAPVILPWLDKVRAVLLTYLAGCRSGRSCFSLLFGKVCPSGKLAETWPLSENDLPAAFDFGKNEEYAEYREGIFTGYRWYDSAEKGVLFPFGFGLSYTKFDYGIPRIVKESENEVEVKICVKNIGTCDGSETIQLYVSQTAPTIFKAQKELKSFEKVFLKIGEEREIDFILSRDAFTYFDLKTSQWRVERGEYILSFASSSRDIRASVCVWRSGDGADGQNLREIAPSYYHLKEIHEFPREEFFALSGLSVPAPRVRNYITLDSPLCDLRNSRLGKLLYWLILKIGGKGKNNGERKMRRAVIADMPLRCLSMGANLTREKMQGIADLCNGHWIAGLKKLVKSKNCKSRRKGGNLSR